MTEVPTPVPAKVRIRDTFLAPRRLAGELAGSTPWLGVLLLSTAIAALAVFTAPDDVFLEPMRSAVTRRGAPVEITSDPDVIVRWGRAMGMLAAIATHPIIAFVLAGVLTIVFSILGRGRGSFLEYLSLSSHGLLIPALGTLLLLAVTAVSRMAGAGDPFIRLRPDGGGGDALVSTLVSFDPFVAWMLVVLGIGVSHFDQRRSAVATTGILLAGYLVFVVATVYFAGGSVG